MNVWATSRLCQEAERDRAERDAAIAREADKVRRENSKAWERANVSVPKRIREKNLPKTRDMSPSYFISQQKAAIRWRKRPVRGELRSQVLSILSKHGAMTLAELVPMIPDHNKANISHACLTLSNRGELVRGIIRRAVTRRHAHADGGRVTVSMRVPIYKLPTRSADFSPQSKPSPKAHRKK